MTDALMAKWNERYRRASPESPEPAAVLTDGSHLLPAAGRALDLACGEGGSALFLARRGIDVTARDISAVAVDRLRARAHVEGLRLTAEVTDIERLPWPPDHYDVIVVSRYLQRALAPAIMASLNPGGLLFYQTFTANKQPGIGPTNPNYLLGDNELLDLFRGLKVRFYREDARCGNAAFGRRNEAYFVGQKPC
ncbi:MAG: class I SAM-dependent methyltransferase [Methylotetracoccus sp.]|nr:class I SAM-dependent methyltransferase [Methylotetracoccus sp.]